MWDTCSTRSTVRICAAKHQARQTIRRSRLPAADGEQERPSARPGRRAVGRRRRGDGLPDSRVVLHEDLVHLLFIRGAAGLGEDALAALLLQAAPEARVAPPLLHALEQA